MKLTYSMPASAVMIVSFLAPAYGATKLSDQTPSAQAQAVFEQIDRQAAVVADEAFKLRETAKWERDPDLQAEELHLIKEEVNRIGAEIQRLEAKRGSIDGWEASLLDQMLPIVRDVADNTQEAIRTFNDHETLPRNASSYVGRTARITQDIQGLANLLSNRLKVARTVEKEMQIEQNLGEGLAF
jgi:hypothetical protein